MPSDLLNKELETANEDLQKQVSILRAKEAELTEIAEKFRTIFENANDMVVYTRVDGTILEVNDRLDDIFGYKKDEVVGKHFADFDFLSSEDLEKTLKLFGHVTRSKIPHMKELNALRKDGTPVVVEVNTRMVINNGELKGVINIIRDITGRKQTEEALRKHSDHLDDLVRERTQNLEDANTALRVLLKQGEQMKSETEEIILSNVKQLVLPYIEKLKKSSLNDSQKTCLDILESNLNDVISPFANKLSSMYRQLTPAEIQVASLIKHGRTTKEIAGLLNLSPATINFHRANIRKKLNLKKLKANLRSSLLSLG